MPRRLSATDRATDLRTRPPGPPAPVVVVDPRAWARALRLAEGDRRRLKVLDDGAVVVCNPRHRLTR